MPNLNTIADAIQVANAGNPVTLANPIGHLPFAVGGGTVVLSIPNPMALIEGSPSEFAGRSAQGLPLVIRASGLYTYAPFGTFRIDVNQGTAVAPAIATTGLITAGASAAGLTSDNWSFKIDLMWDALSTNLRGVYSGWIGSTLIDLTALDGGSLVTVASLAALQFTVAVTGFSSNPGNLFTLTQFDASVA